MNYITTKNYWERLMDMAPETFKFEDNVNKPAFQLVVDAFDKYPTFERTLYCYLDYDLVIFMICMIAVVEKELENPMVAIFIAYLCERFFMVLRRFLGERNLVKKTFTSESFLL